MSRFTIPRDLYHGKGSLEELKNLQGKKAMVVVGGGSMKRFGFLDQAVAYLKEAGMEVALIEGVEPDPSVTTVLKGAEKMREFEPDWIVAMGGGSPIDAAKAMWHSMNIRIPSLKTFAHRLISRHCGQRQSSVQFRLHPVRQPK